MKKYTVRQFSKNYSKHDTIEKILDLDFGNSEGDLLFISYSLNQAQNFFNNIKVDAIRLRRDNEIRFYYLDEEEYDEEGGLIGVEGIDFKRDLI